MKIHTMYFLILKISFVTQFLLVITGNISEHSIVYLTTDFVFKTSLGLFLMLYFFFNNFPLLYGYDKVVISFGGALLVYDSFYNVLPKILKNFNVEFNPFSLTSMLNLVKP
jgi:hypothetical protein